MAHPQDCVQEFLVEVSRNKPNHGSIFPTLHRWRCLNPKLAVTMLDLTPPLAWSSSILNYGFTLDYSTSIAIMALNGDVSKFVDDIVLG